jgi:radical SAM superfamily enzyme YgiQ (UPF0313 family)
VSRVCLITALTIADFIDPDLTSKARVDTGAQLGVFTLAAVLREEGYQPHVVNLDQLFLDYLKQTPPTREGSSGAEPPGDSVPPAIVTVAKSFFTFVVEHLGILDVARFDVFGLSSICSSYPLTLRLADDIRRLSPHALVILGGPQASVVDVATMKAFSSVDLVIRGEAEDALPSVLKILASPGCGEQLTSFPGITFWTVDGEVHRNSNGPVIHDLDRVPFPAYDLDPDLRDRGGAHLEIGRGCPFACTFCSTNDFFRRNFRLKSPARMLAEMRHIADVYGLTYFSLVHDMYTIDHKRVREFCRALEESGNGFTWGCSARTDCVDDELIATMAHAGCRGIFFGIETGSKRLQTVISKDLDLSEAWQRIEAASRHGIATAVALITGFPDETREDLRDTIHFFIEALRFDFAEPQLSLLAPLAGTPIYEEHKHHLVYDDIFSDMSYQGWRQDPDDVELIKRWPDVFPNFYAVPTKWVERQYFKDVRDFVAYVATWFRWLPVALLHDSGDLLSVFERWRAWQLATQAVEQGEDRGAAPYYTHRQFRKDFLEFVRTEYLVGDAPARAAFEALLVTEGLNPRDLTSRVPSEVPEATELTDTVYPYLARNSYVKVLGVDYQELIKSLRNKSDLAAVPRREVSILFRTIANQRVQVWQLAPESAAVLRYCDGQRTLSDIVQEFSRGYSGIDGISAETVARFALSLLRQEGFLALSNEPVTLSVGDRSPDEASDAFFPRMQPPDLSATQRPWPPGPTIAAAY